MLQSVPHVWLKGAGAACLLGGVGAFLPCCTDINTRSSGPVRAYLSQAGPDTAPRSCDNDFRHQSEGLPAPYSSWNAPSPAGHPRGARMLLLPIRQILAAGLAAVVALTGPRFVTSDRSHPADPAGQVRVGVQQASALTDEQELVNEAWRVVNQAYVDRTFNGQDWKGERLKAVKRELKRPQDAYAAIKDMMKVLGDPYTRFLSPDEYQTIASLARGDIAGIGVELSYGGVPGDLAVVSSLVEGAPAEKGGLRTGDVIVDVDSQDTKGMSLDAIAALLRGRPGTTVRVSFTHGGGAKVNDVTLTRQEIKFGGVTSELRELKGGKKAGVITIKSFSKDTASDVLTAVKALRERGADLWVVDLRHDPGGYFPGGVDTARLFLPADKTIVSVVDKNGISDSFETLVSGVESERPMYLLVDEKTASASEIFAAALGENGRAKLVGHKTFGKAKVQTLNQLSDGSAVAVTVSLYKTPKGNDINKVGIPVDVQVDCPYPGDALACIPDLQ